MSERYIYPPRTKRVASPSQLADFEQDGSWLAQRKYNGDRCPVQIIDNKVTLWNRHGQRQKYSLHKTLEQELLSLNLPEGENWLDGELVHTRVPHTIVLFDVLQLGGMYLHSTTQEKRLEMLHEVCNEPTSPNSLMGYPVGDHLFLAQTWKDNFPDQYEKHIKEELIEGLVLRQKNSFFGGWGNKPYEVNWMVRCRKNSKLYRM